MRVLVAVLILALCASCKIEPEPLRYGQDVCHTCKMTLMDKHFGAELVSEKGRVFKFDDVNCMVNFYNSGYVEASEFTHKLVVDFLSEGKLIDAEFAYFLKSDSLRSPMASEVAAFASEDEMKKLKKRWKAIYLSWQETLVQFK